MKITTFQKVYEINKRQEETEMSGTIRRGLVVEGGGMKCVYSAGILDAFLDHGIRFDYCMGVSGGAGNVASFVAGQRGRNLRFYTKHIHEPESFGLKSLIRTGNLFGLQHIYGDLTNSTGKDPLDFAAMMKSTSEYRLAVTNAETGEAEYFGKEDMSQDDYRYIMASCAIPVVSRPVEINGKKYFDGGLADSIPVRRAIEEGCEKLVVILSKPRNYVKAPQKFRLLYTLACRKYPKIISDIDNRHIRYMENLKEVSKLEKTGKAFVYAPDADMKVGTYSMNAKTEKELYNMGVQHFEKRRAELEAFLSEK